MGVRVRDEVTEPLTELEPERLGDELGVWETEADGLSVPEGVCDGDSDALGEGDADGYLAIP